MRHDSTISITPESSSVDVAIAAAYRFSRYFQRIHDADAGFVGQLMPLLSRAWTRQALEAWLDEADVTDERSLHLALRRLRQLVIGQLLVRDLAGWANLDEVMRVCTELAEVALIRALTWHGQWLSALHGWPYHADGSIMQMVVVGMGKLGGGELNVSSDIDLVYLYPEEGETDGTRPITHHQFFVLLGQRLGRALSSADENGFVFRVDTRLRPWGESGPLAMGFSALEDYLQGHGREWERYAWTKARALTGCCHHELAAIVRPFVFRKYLDYGALDAMRGLHAQIRREVIRRDRIDNIKLGPGGIREIEFVAQVFQLIRGGRDVALQLRGTRETLVLLAQRGLLDVELVDRLLAAYAFLRKLEHRLQYLDDAQTQALPSSEDDRLRLAASMGFADEAALNLVLNKHRREVSQAFDGVFLSPAEPLRERVAMPVWLGVVDDETAGHELAQWGYARPMVVLDRLRAVRQSQRYLRLLEQHRERYDRLAALAIELAAHFADETTLFRLLDILEAIGGRVAYMALLEEYPRALSQLAEICAASQWAARYLAKNPILLDELLDVRLLLVKPDWAAFQQALDVQLMSFHQDTERQMDTLRHARQQQTFHLLAQEVLVGVALPDLAQSLTRLAEILLQAVLPLAWAGVRDRHRSTPRFAIIGYGKLGSRELGYASDLDMVFLYEDEHPDAGLIYARLAQRIITWLTSLTPAGILYDTDLRLRPDGASGLLVSQMMAFADYQRHHAWVWEHQALTRARFVAGDVAIGQQFSALRGEILQMPRDKTTLRQDIVAMRQKIHVAHPDSEGVFDLKYSAGGMIDVEFMVQFLVLAYAGQAPAMAENVGVPALLQRAGEQGLVPADLAAPVAAAWLSYWQMQHEQRLQDVHHAQVDEVRVVSEVQAVRTLWAYLMQDGSRG